ncbi:hypothetical protein NA57DRAFT_51042 [Rhizodiscina lignyota]|uniref:Uncharacterized protein n=1 Tax=Rhizodiscina lignyota TaxID=1504668 RepID=A0A9P4IRT4_9PEZI|nr:hypothetical protein NA57DRAFT_51042 [Rhizodiscina lignyota]
MAPNPSKPHSQTVRGTLDNPKTKDAMNKGQEKNRTQLGDPVSLRAEISDSEPTEGDRGAASASRDAQEQAKSRLERGDEDGQGRDRLYEEKRGKLGAKSRL